MSDLRLSSGKSPLDLEGRSAEVAKRLEALNYTVQPKN
jgi:hypothetical protein